MINIGRSVYNRYLEAIETADGGEESQAGEENDMALFELYSEISSNALFRRLSVKREAKARLWAVWNHTQYPKTLRAYSNQTLTVRCPNCGKREKKKIRAGDMFHTTHTCTQCGHLYDHAIAYEDLNPLQKLDNKRFEAAVEIRVKVMLAAARLRKMLGLPENVENPRIVSKTYFSDWTCPYCGRPQVKMNRAGQPYSYHYHCTDCHRESGVSSLMTEEERASMEQIDADVARLEHRQDLDFYLKAIEKQFLRGEDGWLLIDIDGKIKYLDKYHTSIHGRQVHVATISGIETQGGAIHLLKLGRDYCCARHPSPLPTFQQEGRVLTWKWG